MPRWDWNRRSGEEVMTGMHIRLAAPTDASHIVAGINAVCAEGCYFHTARYEPTPAWEAALHNLDAAPDHLLLVAEAGGHFAGAANLFPADAELPGSRTGEMGIFVLKPFRGQGIGTALLDALLTHAAKIGYERVVLSVLASNSRAIRLYRKFGFVTQGRRRREYAFLGEQDELIMARSLNGCVSQE